MDAADRFSGAKPQGIDRVFDIENIEKGGVKGDDLPLSIQNNQQAADGTKQPGYDGVAVDRAQVFG